jgi:hypothetical protein
MADYLAARGFIIVAFDHLGVGSSSPVDDIFLVTPALASAVNDYAHRAVMEGLVSESPGSSRPPPGSFSPPDPPAPPLAPNRRSSARGYGNSSAPVGPVVPLPVS